LFKAPKVVIKKLTSSILHQSGHTLLIHSLAANSAGGDEKGVGSPPHPEPRAPSNKKMTVMNVLQVARGKKRKLTMVTAYDYPTAIHVCRAGIDVLLVGDSVGMVVSGAHVLVASAPVAQL
jgi:Ketopantoate hydroxymethyltransferase